MTRTSWDLTGLTNRSWSCTKMIQFVRPFRQVDCLSSPSDLMNRRPSFADLIPVPAYR